MSHYNKCIICRTEKNLNELTIAPLQEGEPPLHRVQICANCEDAIAAVAVEAVEKRVRKLERRLARLEGVALPEQAEENGKARAPTPIERIIERNGI